MEDLTSIRKQWEDDLGLELTEENWENGLDRIHSSSMFAARDHSIQGHVSPSLV